MPLETSTTIKGLQTTWPDGDDDMHEGDDHLRLIKSVLKTIFAGSDPDPAKHGFETPITVDPEDINMLTGIRSNVQDQLDAVVASTALIAPSGTIMLFQDTIPAGWALVTGLDNRYLRVDSSDYVKGNKGGTDGTNFTVTAHDHTTDSMELEPQHLPAHDHSKTAYTWKTGTGGSTVFQSGAAHSGSGTASTTELLASVGGNVPHEHGNTGFNLDQTIKPNYTNIVLAQKA